MSEDKFIMPNSNDVVIIESNLKLRGQLTDIYMSPEAMEDIKKWRMFEDGDILTWWRDDYLLYERIMEHGY